MHSVNIFISTILLIANQFSTSVAQEFVSPCPSLFSYDPEGVVGDRWYGTITLVADSEYSGLWMRTIFDRPFTELGTDFGEAVQREPTEFLIRKSKHKIAAGETIQIRIYAKFNPSEQPPRLLGFRLNGRTVCPENGQIESTTPALTEQLVSPCPDLFSYEISPTENDRWYGTINLKSNRELSGVWLRVILDRPSMQLGVSSENWFGEVTTEDNKEYLIKNRNHKIKVGETTPVRFFVKYNPTEPVPKLVMYRLNAETVCPESGVVPSTTAGAIDSSFTSQSTGPSWPPTSSDTAPDSGIFGSDFDPSSRPGFLPGRDPLTGVSSRYPCGTVAAQPRPLITHGEMTREGQWPWHAALYYAKGIDLQYICGASLITLTHVLTAAHCVAKRSTNQPVNVNDIQVVLGKYHLRTFTSSGIQTMSVEKITIFPEYNHRYFVNDIAIIKLAAAADYTDFVRPVCLWSDNNMDINNIVNKTGTIVGWGYDQTGKVTETLTKANMPVVSHSTCIWSYPEFFSKFANDKTFCAGFRNGTSVCNGDSGGGLVFPKQNTNPNQPVWQIRGIVSISVALQSEFICDTSHYAIFTDTTKYLDWIKQNVIN